MVVVFVDLTVSLFGEPEHGHVLNSRALWAVAVIFLFGSGGCFCGFIGVPFWSI